MPSLSAAIPPFVQKIAVVVDAPEHELALLRANDFTLQFSGGESPEVCEGASCGAPYLKVFHVKADARYESADLAALAEYRNALWHFDSDVTGLAGGTGTPFAWRLVEPLARMRRIVVAGGLNSQNVGECIRLVRPFAVDVRSGIESDGRKDAGKMRAFVDAVREADATA